MSTPVTSSTINPVDAIWSIIQSQSKTVRHAIYLRFKAEEKQDESSHNETDILGKLNALEPGPNGFLQLDTILPPSQSTIEELREDAYTDKYGI